LRRGFVYLAAVLDWFCRKVLAWQVSVALETVFCIKAVEDAMARYGNLYTTIVDLTPSSMAD